MNLYIQIKDGVIFKHPIHEDNFKEAFPDVDVNNLPPEFAKFERVEAPTNIGIYEVAEVSYQWVDGIVKDVWAVCEISAEEKLAKQEVVKTAWANRPQLENFSAWTFNEATCLYEPPIPRPQDGKKYFWQGNTSSWVERPQYPNDGKEYRLDFASASWVEVTP
jgi:hypothetical protein